MDSKEFHQRDKDSNKRGLSGEKVCCPVAFDMSNFSEPSRVTNFGNIISSYVVLFSDESRRGTKC